ncbi:sugar ABC transporter ATP-binding protein [Candidatus Izimaplasma bacterium ZiA1]|uniref:ABC transporter ATP-binding protein n=1 Tax=Candidatus Izimoplasma sp. ZiA1 TaxID=2024899 RepID=UPI000BAA55D5|nr:sugar ABC transporter ATP-binding protein [Candidatus Izimaplasma bacterium ZiA1]
MEIKLQSLTKVFVAKDKKETVAVNNMDITIPSGKLIGLLGPSGCGKSTTLYMIAGLLEPTAGKIYFGDEDVTNTPPELRGIGLVFQNYALYPHMTVAQNIMFPLENIKVPKAEALERAQEMADLVGIGELMNRKPKELSGGQQQRVAIARALVKKPRVLLLDEPLSNLDARLRLQTREEIKRIQRETGITTIFVTHDQEEAMSISDEIVLMEAGIKQQVGVPQDVYDQPDNLFVAKFLGTPPINTFAGKLEAGKIMLAGHNIGKVESKTNQEVLIGIRPEGFNVVEKSKLSLPIYMVETIGRDTALIIKDPNDEAKTFRAIVDSSHRIKPGDTVNFAIKPDKLYVFNKDTGELVK